EPPASNVSTRAHRGKIFIARFEVTNLALRLFGRDPVAAANLLAQTRSHATDSIELRVRQTLPFSAHFVLEMAPSRSSSYPVHCSRLSGAWRPVCASAHRPHTGNRA